MTQNLSTVKSLYHICVTTPRFVQIGGMREGDYLVGIAEKDVKWNTHAEVVASIKEQIQYLL